MTDLYVAELRAYDPATAGLTALRYATTGFATGPTETPPNAYFDGRLKQPVLLKRDIFSSGTTSGRSRVSFGDLELINEDGGLDALLGYGFDGRSVIVRRGTVGAAYPSGFTTMFDGTAEQIEASQSSIVIKVRDNQLALDVPINANKYAGDNVLPAGLEGVADDLKGKPKPRVFGSVLNVLPPCVNTAKLIYAVNDGPVQSVGAVYDSGIKLYGGSWATASVFANFYEVWGCCWSPFLGLYVAVGYDTTALLSRVSTSPDGLTWTVRSSAVTEQNLIKWYTVAWSELLQLFVAAGTSGLLITSPDGATWTNRTSGFGATRIIGVTWGEGPALFVAVGVGGVLTTSPNGTTWTARTSTVATDLNDVTYGMGLFAAAGSSGVVITSPDGITWVSRTNSFGGGTVVRSITYGEPVIGVPMFVGVGDTGIVITSLDGSAWAIARLTGVTTNLYRVAFAGGQYVAVGQTGTMVTSPDAIDWQAAAPGFGTTYIYDLAYGTSGWLIVGDLSKYTMNGYATYADLAELSDDTLAPAPGEAKMYLPGGYVRLGSPPAGEITADVTEGAAASDRTAGQMFARLCSDPLGSPLVEFSSSDIAALDTANASVLGFWSGVDEWSVADVLDMIAQSVGAWWGVDRNGVIRVKQFTAPSGSVVVAFTANDLLKPLERIPVNDDTKGLPVWRSIVRYARNWFVQTSGVAGGVTDARRAFLALEWREAKAEDTTVQAAHPLSPQTVEDTLIYLAANALTEATRRQTLRGTLRDRYNIVVPWDSNNATTETLELGDVVSLTHSRFSLTGGPSFRVLGLAPDAANRRLTATIWK